jgi:hypothetical protein
MGETDVKKNDWTEQELDDALRKAFGNNLDGTIFIDGHELRSEFKRAGLRYGLDQGYLEETEDPNLIPHSDDQYTVIYYGLTEKGKVHFDVRKLVNYVASIAIHYLNMAGGEMLLEHNDNIPMGLGGFSESNEDRQASLAGETNSDREAFETMLRGVTRKDLVTVMQAEHYKCQREKILAHYDRLMENE